MSTKFTPGPWVVEGCGIILCEDGEHIASVVGLGSDDPEQEANARLIAAAPDLYAALEELLAWSALITKGELHELTPARVAALAALKKARGE